MELEVREELFCSDGFDCYAWAEEALIERGGRVPELAPLVPQLALLSQSLAKSIHATLHQLAVSTPQLQTQLDALQSATAPLQQQLDAVVAHVGGGDDAAALANNVSWSASHRKKAEERALEHLVTLHDAKQRLQACSQALVEAAKWEKNVRVCFAAVDAIVASLTSTSSSSAASSDADESAASLATRVREMRKSLEVLSDLPGAADRHATMRSLSAQIEATLTPALLALVRADHLAVASVQCCLAIFASIDKPDVVRTAFCQSRPSHVHRMWYAFDGTSGGDEASQDWPAWLESFYNHVLAMLTREAAHGREIFGHRRAERVLLALVHSTLASLSSSFETRLVEQSTRSSSRGSGASAMASLVRAFEQSTAFVQALAQLVRSVRETQSLAVLDADDTPDDTDDASSTSAASAILASVLSPYAPVFRDYARFAGDALSAELQHFAPSFATPGLASGAKAVDRGSDDDNDDTDGGVFANARDDTSGALEAFAQRLEDASPLVWSRVDESVRQCAAFSAGAAFPDAVTGVTAAVTQFAQTLRTSVPAMRAYCNLPVAAASTSRRAGARETAAEAGVGSDAAPDWTKFHAALTLLRATGALESELCNMEIRVRARVQEQLSQFALTERAGSPRSRKAHDELQSSDLSELADRATIVAAVARSWLHADAAKTSAFVEFRETFDRAHAAFDASTPARAVLFEDAQRALGAWTREVQVLTFDTVFVPVARLLERVPTMEVRIASWIKTPDAALGDLPSFSMLPQEYITAVADLLLSLLPQLEQFAESSSLAMAAVATRGAHDACVVTHWRRLGVTLRLTEAEVDACVVLFIPDAAAASGADDSSGSAANDFVDRWTSAVASGALAALLTALCAIPVLSDLGAQQLSADLSYFHNVLSAVTGEPSALVDDVRHALTLSLDDHAAHVAALRAKQPDSSSDDGGDDDGGSATRVLVKLHEWLVDKRARAAYSRHPNYLGEILIWIGVYVTAVHVLPTTQYKVLGLLGPLFIIVLLSTVSGIPVLEKQADERWGHLPEYQSYKARTSLLLLWPTKKSATHSGEYAPLVSKA